MTYLCKLFISHSLRLMPGILMGKGFSGMKGYGTLIQGFLLVGKCPLRVVNGLKIGVIEVSLFNATVTT
jgi:hypothetical protein